MELGRGSVGRGSARRYGTGMNLLLLLSQKDKRCFYSSSKLKTISLCFTCYDGMKLKKIIHLSVMKIPVFIFFFLVHETTNLSSSSHRCFWSHVWMCDSFLSHTSLFGVFGMTPSPQTYVDVDRAPTPTTGMSLAIASGPWPPHGWDRSTFIGEHTYIYYSSHSRFH
jgi:hypothetical protein